MKSDVSAVLRKALELLGPHGENWIKGYGALDEDGEDISDAPLSREKDAVCWCAGGAIIQSEAPRQKHFTRSKAFKLFEKVVGKDLPAWNDAPERTFADIERAFRRAIAEAEKEK